MNNQINPSFQQWVKEFNISSQYSEHEVRETRKKLQNVYYKFGGYTKIFTKIYIPIRLKKLFANQE